jgi:hypothetical protein
MPAVILPRNSIQTDWSLGESGWKPGMDANLHKIDAYLYPSVDGMITASSLPSSATPGKQWYLTDTNQIATWISTSFDIYTVPIGFRFHNQGDNSFYKKLNSSVEKDEMTAAQIQSIMASNATLFYADSSETSVGAVDNKAITPLTLDGFWQDLISIPSSLVPGGNPATPAKHDLPLHIDNSSIAIFGRPTIRMYDAIDDSWHVLSDIEAESKVANAITVTTGAADSDKLPKTNSMGLVGKSLIGGVPSFLNDAAATTFFTTRVGGEEYYSTSENIVKYWNNNLSQWRPIGEGVANATTLTSYLGTITTNSLTASNVWQDISATPNIITLTAGTWDLFYKCDYQITYLAGTLPYFSQANVALAINGGLTPIADSISTYGVALNSTAETNFTCIVGKTTLTIGATTSYKIIHRGTISAGAITNIRCRPSLEDEVPGLTGQDSSTYLWAIKKA